MNWRSFGKDSRTPRTQCRGCGAPLSGAAASEGQHTPQPGNFSICFYCGHYAVFDEKLRLREPTDAEMLEFIGDPEVLRMQKMRKRERGRDEEILSFIRRYGRRKR